MGELQRDEKNLEQKAKKKQLELDRCRTRLTNLVNVRPAFMDEFDRLEEELERFYEQYVGRFRNLDYLEHELDSLNREEKERMEENERALKKLQKRLREEEWALLRGEDDEKSRKARGRKQIGGASKWTPGTGRGVYGGMDPGDVDDDCSSEESVSSSDPPISIGPSHESGEAISMGGSGSEDDILNESDDDESKMN